MTGIDKEKMICETCIHGISSDEAWKCGDPLEEGDPAREKWGTGDTSSYTVGCSHWKSSIHRYEPGNVHGDLKQAYEQLTIAQAKCTELELERRELAKQLSEQQANETPTRNMWSLISFPRPIVVAFAIEMERMLRRNDHKGGWEKCSDTFLLSKLFEELGEVGETLNNRSSDRLLAEAADAANILMMIADNNSDTLYNTQNIATPEMLLSKLIRLCEKSSDGNVSIAAAELRREIEKLRG